MAVSLLGLLACATTAAAQSSVPATAGPATLIFSKEAGETFAPNTLEPTTTLIFSKEAEDGSSAPALIFSKEADPPAPPADFEPLPILPLTTPDNGIVRTQLKIPAPLSFSTDEAQEYQIHLTPPGPERVFGRLDSEKALQERMRQEARQRPIPERITFPRETVVTTEVYQGRHFPPMYEILEPAYVCYGRLLFEQKNLERYGWDLGPVQPLLSGLLFFADVACLPYNLGKRPCQRYETNAGYCLPGDPVPLYLYPPEISVPGTLTEASILLLLFVAFP
ncbi:MAG: hypothetical protein ACK4RK_09385 [Gemmataceae bacterium]